jgi:nicotinate phosphoribosyltransferase
MEPKPVNWALLTDLYELTMAAGYYRHKMFAPATFSLFIRKYPENRGYFVSAGLEEVLEFLESFRYDPEDIDYLDSTGLFDRDFLHYLSGIRFTGDVVAMPEGELFFKDEPVLEVTAPIIEGQIVETFIINAISLQTTIASKASRALHAAGERGLVDFSLRRTHGTDAGMKVARAAYLAGFSGTSNVMAGKEYGIPISGTMAHSYVTSFDEEIDSFRAFAETFPENTVLLIDTYDTLEGARKAVTVAREMEKQGHKLRGVRLDSGDMAELSREVRKILREAGLDDVSIFASGGFDEHKIHDVLSRGGDIDAFGVGTKVGVSADAPYFDIAYKLVQYDGRAVLKLSSGKKTLVGKKQVFRTTEKGRPLRDTIALREENLEGTPLLEPVMENGRRTRSPDSLEQCRERFLDRFEALDASYKSLFDPPEFPVGFGPGLEDLQQRTVQHVKEKELGES